MNPIPVIALVLLARILVQDPPLDTSVQQLDECLYSHAISYVPNSPAVYEQAKTIISDYLVAAGQKKRQHRVGWCRRRLGAAFYTLKTLVPGHTLTNELSLPSMGPLGLPPPLLYFDCHVPILLDLFSQTHPQQGLSLHALPALQQHYGINTLPLVTKPKASTLLYHQMTDLMILILLAAAIVEAAQKDFDSMVILLVVVALSTTIGFTQEWKACQTLFAMMDLSQPMAKVIRDGNTIQLSSRQLVPGDLVLLTDGDSVPADLRLIETYQLEIVETILSGESLPVQKKVDAIYSKTRHLPLTECYGNAFMSTIVTHGHGKGVVVRTGSHTEIGKINATLRNASSYKVKTRIQLKLESLGRCLVGLSILLCFLVVVIGILWKRNAGTMINVGLSLAVSVIPEGLVAVTTITMALAVRRMMKKKCIVRTLPAVETLGNVTAICTDKTGTLTCGIMEATELWTTDNTIHDMTELSLQQNAPAKATPASSDKAGTLPALSVGGTIAPQALSNSNNTTLTPLEYAMMVCALCNNASLHYDPDVREWKSVGTPTEVALLSAAQTLHRGPNFWKRRHLSFEKHLEHAFDSTRRLMTIVYATTPIHLPLPTLLRNDTQPSFLMVCKGAPEDILRRCTHYYASSIVEALDDSMIQTALFQNERLASQGQRVIGLAVKFTHHQEHFLEQDLTFVGLIGLVDPAKRGVKEAIEVSQQAGISIIMITGDQAPTAMAMATHLGITHSSTAVSGKELDELSVDGLAMLDPFPCVFARVTHDNKLKIIRALQQKGHVLAMVGDGVNDSTAVKQADIGIVMGSGTEITKQAADMVLLDNNFFTLVAAIEEGRHVFDNILKFMVYLLSCNGAEIILMLICVIFNIEMPLTTMMILWANIIADIPPAMALGVEPKEPQLMARLPRQASLNVLTWASWVTIGYQALSIASLTLTVYLLSIHVLHHPLAQSQSVAFTTLTTLQLVHSFLSKSITQSIWHHGIVTNHWLVLAFVVSFSLLIMGIYIPGISSWLQLTFVDAISWVMVLACCLIQVILVESGKWCLRSYCCVI